MLSSLLLIAAAAVGSASAQSLKVVNQCPETVFLFTQTSFGSIANNVQVAAGATQDMAISTDWDGAINVGSGCNSDGTVCTTGGPTWNGATPFSRAEFNFWAIPGEVTYDISLIYGYNVGMEISTGDSTCAAFACDISSGCPVPGPAGPAETTCYSPCCSSAADCAGGALPAGGGGCVDNAGPGPESEFYYTTCLNAYAFPDNDGAASYTPKDFVDETCSNTDVTLTLCAGTTTSFPLP
ncbi:Osmotin thaumatin-like protein [Stereum hirsutum FP-91666 SS1]|uniref:Osmotin thaumatin-like protein n=1 Tax=Stereum hirsutum (strain FP-91666) TaxID=721885 RepID=UPI000440A399|nr:Osmotin thaumatin-like protein [Stereum hirsutum FP-91666 SS1]EIM88938.1 Osmotin thaumatin-like protein [Stereum hirsutum FP-91666 SS1]